MITIKAEGLFPLPHSHSGAVSFAMSRKLTFAKSNLCAVISAIPVLVCLAMLFWAKGRIQTAVITEGMTILLTGVYDMCASHSPVDKEESVVREVLSRRAIGSTGYIFVLKGTGPDRGRYIVSKHGLRDGEMLWNERGRDGRYFVRDMISRALSSGGSVAVSDPYQWTNPGEAQAKDKVAYLIYYEPWDWVIGASVYVDDAYQIAGRSIGIIVSTIYMVSFIGLIVLVLSVGFGYYLNLMIHAQEESLETLRRSLQATIIHDLKNPLASIAGSIAMLRDTAIDSKVGRELVEIAFASTKVQQQLIDTLVDVEKLETAALVPFPVCVDPAEAVGEMAKNMSFAAKGRNITIRTDCQPDLPQFAVDSVLLDRILANLITNAIKYSPSNSEVLVSVKMRGDRFRFEVKDSGPGIPSSAAERLFQKFYRVEGADRSKYSGSGLGLYFCKLAVEAHGGEIGVNTGSGGTSFWFELPHIPPASGELPKTGTCA